LVQINQLYYLDKLTLAQTAEHEINSKIIFFCFNIQPAGPIFVFCLQPLADAGIELSAGILEQSMVARNRGVFFLVS
jgi:hypothetical protein